MSVRKVSRRRKSGSRASDADCRLEERTPYWYRWAREHPRVCVQFSREEFEFLQSAANSLGLSYRELIVSTVRSLSELQSAVQRLREYEGGLLEREGKLEERRRELEDWERALAEREKSLSELQKAIPDFVRRVVSEYVVSVLRGEGKAATVCVSAARDPVLVSICRAVVEGIEMGIEKLVDDALSTPLWEFHPVLLIVF